MEAKIKPVEVVDEKKDEQKEPEKKSFGKKFVNFLMYGGFLVFLILGMVIFIAIDALLK